ncbi:putative ankyrin repeat domain-containing protein 30B-like isoform X3 [Peromyscus eremicus]|uniref:putative ankyrin repeat domain-containing protein 30B-like isoform X3 n=1 Tax=Peromyscus eremicus TaxID=42410 RepID=UPI0027DD886C|nr:putative ankyrin repeat domain-containing protein 30B-like isoform X3 [Peromyscus eremicus]
MLSTPRKLLCFKKEPKTPLGFCDGPSRATGYLSCFHCGTEDRYCQAYDPENEFHEAVCMGKLKVVVRLLRKKQFHVNDEDEGKRTALHFACFYGHIDLVRFLIFKDCEINALDNQMSTPLMKAVQSWETEIVSVLLDHGADPNIKDCNGEAAIHHAVNVDRPDIASSLLEFGGNIEDTTKDGLTPLLLALRERKPRMAAHLITHGANLHASDQYLRKMVIIQHDLLLWRQQNTFTRNQPEDVFSSGHHFESESLISVYTGMEDTANLKTQSEGSPAVHQLKFQISIRTPQRQSLPFAKGTASGSNSPAGRETDKGRLKAMKKSLTCWSTGCRGSREKRTQLQILPGVPRQAAPGTECGHISIIFS